MAIRRNKEELQKYCSEPIEKIEGYSEAISSPLRYDCHHVLETKYTVAELKRMDLYFNRPASELKFMLHSDHMKLHRDRKMPSCVQGESHPAFRKFGEDSKSWKGDSVSVQAKYVRALKKFKRGLITEEELQPIRREWAEYQKINIKPKRRAKLKENKHG